MISWKAFESNVKEIASFIWNKVARPENINGVNFDNVIRLRNDYWIIIEATENENLDKVRTDCAKINAARYFLFSRGVYTVNYIVMRGNPTASMITTGEGNNVKVLSYEQFSSEFINYENYFEIRTIKPFGSSINPFSGSPDSYDYTPVYYEDSKNGKTIDLNSIAKLLLNNERIIMLGNYGTGKSRCIRELFYMLSKIRADKKLIYPIAINLKDNWGTISAEEIIRRHFSQYGLSDLGDPILKILDKGNIVLLLDGFDEIGSQSWSDDASRLKHIRASSLSGVKDLIQKTKGAVIITGREHYFNSQNEMFSALGISSESSHIFKCKDEFTIDEMKNYLRNISSILTLPAWLPRRPLICQIINSIDRNEFEEMFIEESSQILFWKKLIQNICERESRIHPILDPITIRRILSTVAKLTRDKKNDVGPISISDLNKAFEIVTGTPPVDESAVMLQRLPGLGRISSENTDRQFIDLYILDGLRAENLIEEINQNRSDIYNELWFNPLNKLGIELVANEIQGNHTANHYLQALKIAANSDNKVLPGDLFASLVMQGKKPIDMENLEIKDTHIKFLALSENKVINFGITDSIIEELDITNTKSDGILINGCIIKKLYGVSSEKGVPEFLKLNQIEDFDTITTLVRIKTSSLTNSQKIFVSIIKKTFFQPGSGRKEEALKRGLGDLHDKKIVEKILNKLLSERILERIPGDEGWIYKPKRHHTKRMEKIIADLTLSSDVLWEDITKMEI